MIRSLAAAFALCLTVAGCSSAPPLDGVTVKSSGKSVKVSAPKNFKVDQTEVKVLHRGTGAKIGDGDTVNATIVLINGRNGKTLLDTNQTKAPFSITVRDGSSMRGLVKAAKGQRVGAHVLAAIAPVDGPQQDDPSSDLKKYDTLVADVVLTGKVPTMAHGAKKALPASVPALVLKAGKPAAFHKTASSPATVVTSSAHIVIAGKGPKVPEGSTVTAHYLGQVYPGGVTFDSSWDRGTAASFPLTGVIPCWQDLLPGVRVGSRVVLVCSAKDAYGDSPQPGSAIKPGDALLFSVDILSAQ